ncbi:MAG: sodium-translocating pyrophosphatase [Candidatus Gastranaerophilales bacterium]|nr:sodium-translocating pyrophosphatase [Candidatus Gastranaerophilales bacterium]
MKKLFKSLSIILSLLAFNACTFASEANLIVPDFREDLFNFNLLKAGIFVAVFGVIVGLFEFHGIKKIKVHPAMEAVGTTIFETCKTYLIQQGKFLIILEALIAICIAYYFGALQNMGLKGVGLILLWSVIGILGSYFVAWFGIRMNTLANARTSFLALHSKPLYCLNVPLRAGMSIGVLLVCVELILMLVILLFVPGELAGACFIGFAIGESLGASALRVAGGIFTKIADIGSDLMKIQFGIKEDDPRNPGVIADCTGDNAGDSIGPSADGFETYGVTGVALVSFILLAVAPQYQIKLLAWIFTMRFLMIITSLAAYWINNVTTCMYAKSCERKNKRFDFEKPLSNLVWLTSVLSIIMTFSISKWLLGSIENNLWLVLASIISCGTLGAALIPEFTKLFTSPKAKHTHEVVTASREGGASLTILSGIVSGNFSGFWIGAVIVLLMGVAYFASLNINGIMIYPSVFAFGLVAFGFLGMGPVTIAVDSYGPVTDNAQSVYELSLIEEQPDISLQIEKAYGFTPDFENAKKYLEENDGAGNTFKATSKPVLIGTAVVGATTMIFSLILVIKETLGITPESILNLLNPYTLLGFITGGAVIYWFSGASMQAVTTGAYRAVEYIKKHIKLGNADDKKANLDNSKEVVKICTQYAQKGMFNIFVALFTFALALAFLSSPTMTSEDPVSFFVSYLIAIAVFGLFQAVFMANAGGCWDNAKKIVEVDLEEKGTPLHDATVVGDTVGDPFKDTSSVAMNPIIKFTTLFGLLAMEIAISEQFRACSKVVGAIFLIIALFFVIRSFYAMRIPVKKEQ